MKEVCVGLLTQFPFICSRRIRQIELKVYRKSWNSILDYKHKECPIFSQVQRLAEFKVSEVIELSKA